MPVTFLLGRAGSGKTARCFRRAVDSTRQGPLGPPILWLVPKQMTFLAEREFTTASGLGALSRVRVLSFDQLAADALSARGGAAVPQVTPLGRQMALAHLLRRLQPRLTYFKSSARQPGLAAELDATFAEMERAGKTAADLAQLIADLEISNPADADGTSLVAKLRDLRLVYDAYGSFLGQDRLDPHRRQQHLLDLLTDWPLLRGATTYVDGFLDFSDHERKTLATLAKACQTLAITLPLDADSPSVKDPHHLPEDTSLFRRTEQAYRNLWFTFHEAGVEITDPVLLRETPRFRSTALRFLERETFTPSPGTPGEGRGEGRTSNPVIPQRDALPLPSAGEGGGEGERQSQPAPLRSTPCHPEVPRRISRPFSKMHEGSFGVPQDDKPPLAAIREDHSQTNDRAILFLTAPDRASEAESIARHIRTLLSQGFRYRDIAVLVRSLDDYHAPLAAVFREHDIPCFVDVRRTAAHHPLLQFVRAVVRIARFDWPHESVMTLLKSGLACMAPDEADAVEEYVLDHRIRGGVWESADPWTFRRDLTRSAADDDPDAPNPARLNPAQIDAARRGLVDRLRPLLTLARNAEPATLRAYVVTILQLLESCGARQTLANWMAAAAQAGDFEQHDEHAQVWAELVTLLEQMNDLLGGEVVSAAEFSEILESGLERFDLAITPPTLDQVLVGQIDRTRTPPRLRAAFVPGLCAGEFPRAARDHTVLSDAERREIRRHKLELEGDGRQGLLDETLLGYLAFTRSADLLCVSRPLSADGKRPSEPSSFWLRLRELFPDVPVEEVPPAKDGDLTQSWTPRQVIVSLMHWVRNPGAQVPEGTAAVYQWLATRRAADDSVARLVRLAWPALAYSNEAELSRDVASRLFAAPLEATAAQLETFAACAFRHFLRYGLRLTEREPPGVTGLDLSRVYHHILHALVSSAVRDGIDLADPAAPITDDNIHALAQSVGKSLRGELMLSSARNAYLLDRVEKTLREVIAAHREMLRRGSFRPTKAAVSFGAGPGAALPPLKVPTPRGAELSVSGTIDRVDVSASGAEVTAFDYRLGSRTLSLQEVYHGLSLQLLTGLLALSDAADRPRPAAAFYLQTTRALGLVKHPDEALDPADPRYLLRVKPRGVVEASFVPALDAGLGEGMSEVLNVSVKKDGTFGNRRGSDVAQKQEFDALLAHVRKRLGQLADGILSGEIAVRPYRINTDTPCPQCNYRAVCRFDPAVDRYNHLTPLTKDQVLTQLAQGGPDA